MLLPYANAKKVIHDELNDITGLKHVYYIYI